MTSVASHNLEVVRILEVRFHAQGRGDDFVVVGQIICGESRTLVEPAPDLERLLVGASRGSVVTNLRYLVLMSRPCPFDNLRALASRHWSFVTVCARDRTLTVGYQSAMARVGSS